jgi:hypothetical protein
MKASNQTKIVVSVYVDFAADNATIHLHIKISPTVSANRMWNIKISQIECTDPQRGWNLNSILKLYTIFAVFRWYYQCTLCKF